MTVTHTPDPGPGAGRRASGLYGIATGQVVRLTVVNIHVNEMISARLGFTNNPPVVSKVVRLAPGESDSLDLSAGEVRDAVPDSFDRYGRAELRATVDLLSGDSRFLLATIQVFDEETGRTTVAARIPAAPPGYQSLPDDLSVASGPANQPASPGPGGDQDIDHPSPGGRPHAAGR